MSRLLSKLHNDPIVTEIAIIYYILHHTKTSSVNPDLLRSLLLMSPHSKKGADICIVRFTGFKLFPQYSILNKLLNLDFHLFYQ